MQPGDRILLATDGVVEAENSAGEPFGDAQASAKLAGSEGSERHPRSMWAKFQANHEAQDDCTVVEVRY
jgi:serine phosphatase RsbU (regulator of sigma subunit)